MKRKQHKQDTEQKPRRWHRFLVIHGIVCVLGFSFLFGLLLLYYGPFENYKDYVVVNVMATNQDRFLATAFLSKSEINRIMAEMEPVINRNATEDLSGVQTKASQQAPATDRQAESSASPAASQTAVQIVDITGKTYKGKLMIIQDPSKVTLGLAPSLGKKGAPLSQIVEANHALGGVNAGGFLDDNLTGTGANPDGVVISDGQIKFRQSGRSSFSMIGINRDNVLVISNSMTLDEIQKSNLRCAISFGPALILNGKSLVTSGGATLEPRTAIGQRKDGSILLLAIDGRQQQSPGANFTDTMNVMLQYGAYNAANLDGGSSTTMNYQGKTISTPCDINGERSIATAYMIMP